MLSNLLLFLEKGRQILLKDNLIDESLVKSNQSLEEKFNRFEMDMAVVTSRYV